MTESPAISSIEVRLALHRCVVALDNASARAHRLDARGWDNSDYEWGTNLAKSNADGWSLGTVACCRHMLYRYRAQLEKLEIPFDNIPVLLGEVEYLKERSRTTEQTQWLAEKAGVIEDDVSIKPQEIPRAITSPDGKCLVIQCQFDPRVSRKIQSIPPGHRSPSTKMNGWIVWPDDPDAIKIIRELLADGFEVDAKARALIDERSATYKMPDGPEFNHPAFHASYAKEGPPGFYPLGVKPGMFGYQLGGVHYMAEYSNGRGFFGDSMGLGKTLQAIATICHLDAFPCVVIAPSAVKIGWRREIQQWTDCVGTLDQDEAFAHATQGQSMMKMPGWPDPKKLFYITNYDRLSKESAFLLSIPWKSVIFDEIHYIKNGRAKRSKMAMEIFNRTMKTPFRFGLSGTAIENRAQELIHPINVLGMERTVFDFGKLGPDFTLLDDPNNFNRRLRSVGYCRRQKSEVLTQLPPKSSTTVTVEIDNAKEYEEAEQNLVRWLKTAGMPSPKFLESVADLDEGNRELRIEEERHRMAEGAMACPHLVRITALKRLAAKGKMAAGIKWANDFLEGSDEKLIFFAQHREIVLGMADAMSEYRPQVIIGGQDGEERQKAIDTFRDDPTCRLVVCSLKAGGVGINGLQVASNVAFFEYGWTPAVMEQASDRAHRLGQKDSVTIWNIVAPNTIEEDIIALLDSKIAVVDAVNQGNSEEGGKKSANILGDLIKRLNQKRNPAQ